MKKPNKKPKLKAKTKAKTKKISMRNIYVIKLDEKILKNRKFMAANPDYKPGKPCAYVGMTVRDPKERFAQHKRGYKAAKFAKKYGLRLMPSQYRNYNPMAYSDAEAMEREKARRLRKKGWGVWQN